MPEGTKRYIGITIAFLGTVVMILASQDAAVLPSYFKAIGGAIISFGGLAFGVGAVHKQIKDLREPTR